jgi:hypothetical protein
MSRIRRSALIACLCLAGCLSAAEREARTVPVALPLACTLPASTLGDVASFDLAPPCGYPYRPEVTAHIEASGAYVAEIYIYGNDDTGSSSRETRRGCFSLETMRRIREALTRDPDAVSASSDPDRCRPTLRRQWASDATADDTELPDENVIALAEIVHHASEPIDAAHGCDASGPCAVVLTRGIVDHVHASSDPHETLVVRRDGAIECRMHARAEVRHLDAASIARLIAYLLEGVEWASAGDGLGDGTMDSHYASARVIDTAGSTRLRGDHTRRVITRWDRLAPRIFPECNDFGAYLDDIPP